MMYRKIITRISFLALAFLTILSTLGAIAAANAVPVSYAMDTTIPIDQSQFLPPLCAGMIFDNIIVGSGDINGGPGNDLIYGSSGDDKIRGGMGDDCIIGGGGDDTLRGQNGDDVLVGGSGFDVIEGGPGYDLCYYGDDVKECEVVN
jgi:Ca2+-binding RTX toxin-like protein